MGPKRTIWKTTFIFFFLHNSLSKSNQPGVVAHTFSTSFLGDYSGKNQLSLRAWGQVGQEKENFCL